LSRITRDDVARKAGVSSATVSRVYNSPGSVSEEKRKAVLAAAEALGYAPNQHASSLRRNGTGRITLVEFRKGPRPYYWGNQPLLTWMFAQAVRGLMDEASAGFHRIQMAEIHSPEDLSRLEGTADGIIGFDIDTEEEAERLEATGIPCVIGHHTRNFRGSTRIATDNIAGGRLQGEYLKSRGVRRPLYLTGYTGEVEAHRERLEGFLSVYPEGEAEIFRSAAGLEEGRAFSPRLRRILREGAADGLAGVNDQTLLGALSGLWKEGQLPGGDFPLVGYDNLPALPVFPLAIATVDLRLDRIYRKAFQVLLEKIGTRDSGGGSAGGGGDLRLIPPVLFTPPESPGNPRT